jgi:hypothetical protein
MRRFALKTIVLCMFALRLGAEDDARLRVPMAWFEGPEIHHKHWKVEITKAQLMYNQRLAIAAVAEFPLPGADKARSDLHVVFKVADEKGHWFEGRDYTEINFSEIKQREGSVRWFAHVFVRPGKYRLAVLVYDKTSDEHFLWRRTVVAEAVHPLPDLDQSLPVLEFANKRAQHVPLGEHLPIQNRRPLRIDVVLNLTGNVQMVVQPGRWGTYRRGALETALMGSATALTQLRPAVGCVRVSAIDIVHLEVARDRTIADPGTDWETVRATLMKNRDQQTVDIHTLEGRTRARQFFHDFLGRVIADHSGCGKEQPDTERAVVVVSDSLTFPPGSADEHVPPPAEGNARFYHVQMRFKGVFAFDQVGHMLRELHPHHFDIDQPQDLRRALAAIIGDLEKAEPGEARRP